MNWGRLPNTDANVVSCTKYLSEPYRTYHNMYHIEACFDFLKYNDVPYDIDLELAIWWHDAIYDEYPKKEERSANAWMNEGTLPKFANAESVYKKIMSTTDHLITDDMSESDIWMIKADLSGLQYPDTTVMNFSNIMIESYLIHEVSYKDFAYANIDFMEGLYNRMSQNYKKTKDPFWYDVMDGIDQTIEISQGMIKRYERT